MATLGWLPETSRPRRARPNSPVSMTSKMDIMNLLKKIWLLLLAYRTFTTVHGKLARLSDGELTSIGLTRGEITRVAFDEAERFAWALSDPEVKGGQRGRTLASAPARFV